MTRRSKGEGSVYKRKDGRYEAAAWVLSTDGSRRRLRLYAPTKTGAQARLRAAIAASERGVPVPVRASGLGDYLRLWLEDFVRPTCRSKTYALYESTIRLHLQPGLGRTRLAQLSVAQCQAFINGRLAAGVTPRTCALMKTVLSSALGRAMREEMVTRNVARLIAIPSWERKEIRPWSVDQAARFLASTADEPLHPAYLLTLLYGMRRGEVLGLRWEDIDFERRAIYVRQQIQRSIGGLQAGPVKTSAGRRDLPLLDVVAEALRRHRAQAEQLAAGGCRPLGETVLTSATGRPVEPRNLVRSFQAACLRHGLPVIAVHHLRHTTATMLKYAGVPVRDAQLVLGHAHSSTTQMLYQHGDIDGQRAGLQKLEQLLMTRASGETDGSRQEQPSKTYFRDQFMDFVSGGPGGTRTLDTLLKSHIMFFGERQSTDMMQRIHTKARQHVLGAVAVRMSRQHQFNPSAAVQGSSLWMKLSTLSTNTRGTYDRSGQEVAAYPHFMQ